MKIRCFNILIPLLKFEVFFWDLRICKRSSIRGSFCKNCFTNRLCPCKIPMVKSSRRWSNCLWHRVFRNRNLRQFYQLKCVIFAYIIFATKVCKHFLKFRATFFVLQICTENSLFGGKIGNQSWYLWSMTCLLCRPIKWNSKPVNSEHPRLITTCPVNSR